MRDVKQATHELAKWGFVNNWNGFVNCGLDRLIYVIMKDALGCIVSISFFLIKLGLL